MASITWWNRVEPRPRTPDIVSPLQARIRDPLWLLTRQWQLGEFLGVDSGSPAWVQLTERIGAMTDWVQGDGTTAPLAAAPLEQQLESEPFTPDLATRIELGQVLARVLGDAGADPAPFRAAYPIAAAVDDAADPVETQLRRVCAGRSIDGVAAYAAIQAGDPSVPGAPAAALQAFVTWVESTLGAIGSVADAATWQPARLEYAARVDATLASGTATLSISPGDDGLIDWAAFDVVATANGSPLPASVRTIVPAHVRFKGMPNARFWDFENGTIDFGDMKPDKRDLARLALMDFMLVHANDWFMLPVDMPVGGTYQLDSLIVHDVFGVDTLIQRADRESLGPGIWTMFSTTLSGTPQTADCFVLPPTAGAALQAGRVLEEVRFARDEMANMVWAIENTLENAAGEPWPQHERDSALNPIATPPATQNPVPLAYRVESRVPVYWIPLLPVSLDPAGGVVALELAEAIAQDGHTPIPPRGRILQPTGIPAAQPYQIPEEEVPRNGIKVQRFAARSRWSDGSTRLWQLRRVQPGTGEAQSALRFDQPLPNP
ncbi:MAG TPA: hypothetical protein VHT91_13135 [Kofleriaceae bacterium]|jgi:hypothetical protein|nr:hypothetical protein [Kofleriaceae bacterium]